jgi:probable HAF family extracellular repeat protein
MATLANGVTLLRVFAGDTAGSALGINNLGDVVGWSNPSSGATQALVWSRASAWYPVVLEKLYNNLGSKAYDINEQGQIVGFSYTPSSLTAGVLWENGSVYDLNALAGVANTKGNPRVTWANAINDIGQISGITNVKAGVIDDRAVVLTRKP